MKKEFSFRTRQDSIQRFKSEEFDLLVIGGGITGAATARDASTRGLKVALVEKHDFAWGTSSRSSKLIHGGLRYLENLEFGLVFEALAERSLLLKTVPHMVRPLKFFMPVYQGDLHSKTELSMGLWLYDLLALFRAPGFHKRLSKKRFKEEIPFIDENGLKGGFSYYDASMWDDVLAIETLRSAAQKGAAIANYVEAVKPIWKENEIVGFTARDIEANSELFEIRAHRVVICAGPWTDHVGRTIKQDWKSWLKPSKGVHLVFDRKRLPIPGALVMSHPTDGRISFVIPREDYGPGVVIVGTTDGPTSEDPEKAEVERADIDYLMKMLNRYFPSLKLTDSDILSTYVGVRPLMGNIAGSEGQKVSASAESLQKVSREHHIDRGPGGTVIVAGGKYTTHRNMAEEIVDFTLKCWEEDHSKGKVVKTPDALKKPTTKEPLNPDVLPEAIERAESEAAGKGWKIPKELLSVYGRAALDVMACRFEEDHSSPPLEDPEGFPFLPEQLRYQIRNGMVLHLEDFFIRRLPLFLARKDHGAPWVEELAKVWAEEREETQERALAECKALSDEISRRDFV